LDLSGLVITVAEVICNIGGAKRWVRYQVVFGKTARRDYDAIRCGET